MNLIELAKTVFEKRNVVTETNKAKKLADQEKKDAEKELIEGFIEEGVKSFSLEGVGTFGMSVSTYLNVNKSDLDGFYKYMIEAGHDGLLKLDCGLAALEPFLGKHLTGAIREAMREGTVPTTCNEKTFGVFLDTHYTELMQARIKAGELEPDARKNALEFLKTKGVSYFTERGISVRKE